MTLRGTVVNGRVVLQGPTGFPEGSEIVVTVVEEDAMADEMADMPSPPTESYAEHLAILRESIAAAQAGERGLPLREAMANLDAELQRLAVELGEAP